MFTAVSYIPERLGKPELCRQMLSPYARCNFFPGIALEAFSLDYFWRGTVLLFSRNAALDTLVIFHLLCCSLCCLTISLKNVLCVERKRNWTAEFGQCVCGVFWNGANIVNMVNDSNKQDQALYFSLQACPSAWAVLMLYLLFNTLSLKEALRPQFDKSSLLYPWYLSPGASLSLMSSTSFMFVLG